LKTLNIILNTPHKMTGNAGAGVVCTS